LLAGVGHVTEPPDAQRNFLVVDHKTDTSQIENAFTRFTKERKDIGIILINQHVWFHFTTTSPHIYQAGFTGDVGDATVEQT
jgi:vacuolar-type H+-ATPase subunit F/Vma7